MAFPHATATLPETVAVTYEASKQAGFDLSHVLGVLDAGKRHGIPVDGDSLIASLEAILATIATARDAASVLMIRSGQAG